jgi:hypothetical protein
MSTPEDLYGFNDGDEHEEDTIYMEGMEACKEGVPRGDNPHPCFSDAYDQWEAGWDRANEEREGGDVE